MNSNLYQDLLWRCTRHVENIIANESFKMEHGLPVPTWFANPMVCLYQLYGFSMESTEFSSIYYKEQFIFIVKIIKLN